MFTSAFMFESLEVRTLLSSVSPPLSPTNLVAKTTSASAISLTWKDNSNRESGYDIERSTDDKTFAQIGQVGANATTYTSASLSAGKKYYFRVRDFGPGGNSKYTNVANAMTSAAPVTTPPVLPPPPPSTPPTSSSSPVDGPDFAGVSLNGSESPGMLIPILRTLHVKTVRLFFGMLTWNNRGGDASIQQAAQYKAAGFQVIMNVNAPEVPSYSEASAFFNYIKNKPGALGAVDIWEIGNEPDRPPFWQGTPQEYVNNVLKAAWDVLHPAGAKILGAGPSWDPNFAQTMVDAGYLNYVDYAGMHPYGNSVAEVIDRATRAAKVYAGKPMILSEWNVRGATSQSQWISELNQIAPTLKSVAYEAIYFGLVKSGSLAGPAGLINPDGSPNGGFFGMYESWYS